MAKNYVWTRGATVPTLMIWERADRWSARPDLPGKGVVMTYGGNWASFRAFGLAFAIVLTPALMQSEADCGTGDTSIESLSFEVDGQEMIAFSPDQRVYEVILPEEAEVTTVTLIPTDPLARASHMLEMVCEDPEIGWLPEGGGEVQFDSWPSGISHLVLTVHADGGARGGVSVYVTAPAVCE